MAIYSYSRISCFSQCKLKFKLTYIDKIKTNKTSIEAFMGNRFHETMEMLYRESKFREVSKEELINFYNNKWSENIGKKEIIFANKNRTADEYQTIGVTAINNYFERYKPFKEKTLGLEREIVIDLSDDGKHKLKCIIDRLVETKDNCYEIHDYKTSSFLPEQSSLDKDVQLALYEIAVRKAFANVEEVDLIWHYVSFDKELKSRRSKEQLDLLKEETIYQIDDIVSCKDYPPNESSLCDWCEHKSICPLFVHLEKTSSLNEDEFKNDDAVKLVDEYAMLEEEKKEIESKFQSIENKQDRIKKAIIKKAEDENCKRLYGTSKQVTIKDDIKISYPKSNEIKRAEFEKILKENGIWEYVKNENLSWLELKNYARKSDWLNQLPDCLKDFVEVEISKQIHLSDKK